MSVAIPDNLVYQRRRAWRWGVCGLLLLATTINYMDRLTLNLMSSDIMKAFGLGPRDYGYLESAFGSAFAIGAIIFGWLADRSNIRWLYAAAVLAWSLAGFCTGLAPEFITLLVFRFLLGLAESGNWPCALRTTQHILPAEERPMGNGILQSGAALGAVLTPFIILGLTALTNTWRYPFFAIGAIGAVWVAFWLWAVKPRDLEINRSPTASLLPVVGLLAALLAINVAVRWAIPRLLTISAFAQWGQLISWVPIIVKVATTLIGIAAVFLWLWGATDDDRELDRGVFFRRFWVLALTVVVINGTWHYFRAWLPLILQRVHDYQSTDVYWFSAGYYLSADMGSLGAGFLTLWLAKRYLPVHWSRVAVFGVCAGITSLSIVAAQLTAGPLLLGVFLVIGFGALGLFPNYYSMSQELTTRHQGKLTGALGCICWMSMSLLHEVVGDAIERTGSYSTGVGVAGLAPLLALAVLVIFWGKTATARRPHDTDSVELAPKLHTEAIQPSAAVGVQK
jgi:ACS family hexuronate transporter-like MFS transporter